MSIVVGIDGMRGGWVAVRLVDGRLDEIRETEAEAGGLSSPLLDLARDAEAVGIDMPIGHEDPTGAAGGLRACDRAARAALGARASSVFLIPPLQLFEEPTHVAAVALARKLGVPAPSAQAWAFRGKLRAVQVWASRDRRLHEVHPEVSFVVMAEHFGVPAPAHAKRTWNGIYERLELLRRAGLRPARSLGGVGRAAPDDVLDATAAAWSADRIARGLAHALPERPPVDPASGREVAIWA